MILFGTNIRNLKRLNYDIVIQKVNFVQCLRKEEILSSAVETVFREGERHIIGGTVQYSANIFSKSFVL